VNAKRLGLLGPPPHQLGDAEAVARLDQVLVVDRLDVLGTDFLEDLGEQLHELVGLLAFLGVGGRGPHGCRRQQRDCAGRDQDLPHHPVTLLV